MPSQAAHRRQAEHNRRFLHTFDLASADYLDWVVTVLFYTALHLIDSYLATHGHHPKSHQERNKYIRRYPYLALIWPDYRFLEHRSRAARYDVVTFELAQVERLYRRLETIETHIAALTL